MAEVLHHCLKVHVNPASLYRGCGAGGETLQGGAVNSTGGMPAGIVLTPSMQRMYGLLTR